MLVPFPGGWLGLVVFFPSFVLTLSPGMIGWGITRHLRAVYRDIGNAWPFEIGDFEELKFNLFVRPLIPAIMTKEIPVLKRLMAFRPDADSEALAALGLDRSTSLG